MHKINFQQIKYFLTLAETLNFTDAADILYISQPGLSKQIGALENELGFRLFVRNKRVVELTPEGESLYKDWSVLFKMYDSSVYNARVIGQRAVGNLKIGCTDTFNLDDFLPDIIEKFQKTYPNIDIDVSSHSFKSMREKLLSEEMDVIFTPYFELEDLPDVNWTKVLDITLGVAVPRSNPLSHLDTITLDDLKEQTFIMVSPSESHSGVEKTLRLLKKSFEPKKIKYVSNVNSITLALKSGLGVAICDIKKGIGQDHKIKSYPVPGMPNDSFIIAVWKNHRENLSLDLFCDVLKELEKSLDS